MFAKAVLFKLKRWGWQAGKWERRWGPLVGPDRAGARGRVARTPGLTGGQAGFSQAPDPLHTPVLSALKVNCNIFRMLQKKGSATPGLEFLLFGHNGF